MKKSLIALAALAAVGAASAQSSVTLYGVIDTNYGWSRTKQSVTFTPTVGGTYEDSYVGLNAKGGNLSGSRWGLKGQEDLGNGLSAVFNVEAGFSSSSGEDNGGFNRRAVVGLKGGFGQVLLGNDYTPMDFIGSGGGFQATDLVTGDGVVDVAGTGFEIGAPLYTARAQGIHYSGNFSGVGVMAFAGHNDNEIDRLETDGSKWGPHQQMRSTGYGVGVSYASGPFAIGAAVQQFDSKEDDDWGPGSTTKNTEYGIGASYDFGAAKLHGHWMGTDPDGGKAYNQIGVGVTVPMGAFTLGAQYAYNRASDIMGTPFDAKGHDFVVEGKYALSKRTDLYTRIGRYNSFKVNFGPHTAKSYSDVAVVGVRHRF